MSMTSFTMFSYLVSNTASASSTKLAPCLLYTSSNGKDGIQKALQHFGILSEKELFLSKDDHFNKVKTFHGVMDGETQEKPVVWQPQDALYRTMFKQEELVEFVRAASTSEERCV